MRTWMHFQRMDLPLIANETTHSLDATWMFRTQVWPNTSRAGARVSQTFPDGGARAFQDNSSPWSSCLQDNPSPWSPCLQNTSRSGARVSQILLQRGARVSKSFEEEPVSPTISSLESPCLSSFSHWSPCLQVHARPGARVSQFIFEKEPVSPKPSPSGARVFRTPLKRSPCLRLSLFVPLLFIPPPLRLFVHLPSPTAFQIPIISSQRPSNPPPPCVPRPPVNA